MRVFDFDGTIYDGESLFDLYLFSARYDPAVFRHIAPVLRCAIRYKTGRATLEQMERRVGEVTKRYLEGLERSRRLEGLASGLPAERRGTADAMAGDPSRNLEALVDAFWNRRMSRIKAWYEPRPDDIIVTASFDLTVGEACRRLGVRNLVSSTIDPATLEVTYLNFNTNKPKRFRELYGGATIDEFYTDSRFDQPMIDMARSAYMVRGNRITRVK